MREEIGAKYISVLMQFKDVTPEKEEHKQTKRKTSTHLLVQ